MYRRPMSQHGVDLSSLAVLVTLVLIFAWKPLNGGSDLFLHAAVGRWIIQHHAVPKHTLFLWSASEPWVAHSWLSETIAFEIIRCVPKGGTMLLIGICIALYSIGFAILWLSRDRTEPPPRLLIVLYVVGIAAASARFLPRPEVSSFLFQAILLNLLLRMRSNKHVSNMVISSAAIPVGFAWFAVWSNLHGAVLAGVGLIGLVTIADLLQFSTDVMSRRMLIILVFCGLGIMQIRTDSITSIFIKVSIRPFFAC